MCWGEWYQLLSKKDMQSQGIEESKALHVPQILNGANIYSAENKQDLLQKSLSHSSAMQDDLVKLIMKRIIDNPGYANEIVKNLEKAELYARQKWLMPDLNDSNRSYDDPREEDINFLRSLPYSRYNVTYLPMLVDLIANVNIAKAMAEIVTSNKDQFMKEVLLESTFSNSTKADSIIYWAVECGIGFGDKPGPLYGTSASEDIDPKKVKVLFDVVRSLKAHWNQVSVNKNGKVFDAIAINSKKNDGCILVHRSYIEKKLGILRNGA